MKTRPVRLPPCAAGASPSDEQARLRVAEAGDRPSPVLLVAERSALLARDLLAPRDQARARPALDDLGGERRERAPSGHASRSYGAVESRACEPVAYRADRAPPADREPDRVVGDATPAGAHPAGARATHHELEVAETSRRGHAARLARGAARDGVDVVVVLAGDGTLNEAADGLVGHRAPRSRRSPAGRRTCSPARIGIAYDPVEAAEQLVGVARAPRRSAASASAWRTAATSSSTSGAGFDAAVIAQVERRSSLKRYAAHPVFVVAAVDTWLPPLRPRAARASRSTWTGEVVGDGFFAIVSNQRPYDVPRAPPARCVTPHAGLDVPLALTMFRSIEVSLAAAVAASALRSRHGCSPATRSSPSAPISDALDDHRLRPVPVAGRRRLPRRGRAARRRATSPTSLTLVVPSLAVTPAERSRATSGTSVMTASTPAAARRRISSGR